MISKEQIVKAFQDGTLIEENRSVYFHTKLFNINPEDQLTYPEYGQRFKEIMDSILYDPHRRIYALQSEINRLKDVEKEYMTLKTALKIAIQD